MSNINDNNKHNQSTRNKKLIMTIIACTIFVFSIFFYTIIYRIDHVTAIDKKKYHEAVDKYLNTESYNYE